MTLPIIGFAGTTHLGLVSSICAAEKGFKIVCFDPDKNKILNLKDKKLEVSEPGLFNLLHKNYNNIVFTFDINVLSKCDIVYIAPDVATDDLGKSNLEPMNDLLNLILRIVQKEAVLIILSQVPPGFTRKIYDQGINVFYQVETLIFGQAVERSLYPERFIIGCKNPEDMIPLKYEIFLKSFGCPIIKMRYESAELAKISINMCLVASITTANTLAELCEKIGADWSEIVPALNLDKRIGKHSYLKPGLGVSGGNLERDLTTILEFANKFKTDAGVVKAWINNSSYRKKWPFKVLSEKIFPEIPKPKVGIWGLTYKENTHSIKNSASIELLKKIKNLHVQIFDPLVCATILKNKNFYTAKSEIDACDAIDVLIIMTPWTQFSSISLKKIMKKMNGNIIIDPYKVLDEEKCFSLGFKYFTLGKALKVFTSDK
jgi:UDPglucose 6-dehydrogenase